MNKKMLFKICLVAALTLAAGSALAAGTAITGTTVLGGGTFSPSKNVTITCNSTTTDYAAVSCHQNGDRNIGTNNSDPKIAYGTRAAGSACSTPGSPTQTFSGAGWSSL